MIDATIRLKGLVFYARHGALEEERTLGQRFVVDVVVVLAEPGRVASDRLDDTLNYADLFELVRERFTERRYNLIEACAHDLGGAVLDAFSGAAEVTVAVKKPSVPVDCACDYFEVEVTRSR